MAHDRNPHEDVYREGQPATVLVFAAFRAALGVGSDFGPAGAKAEAVRPPGE